MTVITTQPVGTFIHIPKNAGVAISQWLTHNVHGSYLFQQQHGGKHAKQKRIKKWMEIHFRQKHLYFYDFQHRHLYSRSSHDNLLQTHLSKTSLLNFFSRIYLGFKPYVGQELMLTYELSLFQCECLLLICKLYLIFGAFDSLCLMG